MPDRLEKIRETIRDLEAELASLDSIDQETRSVLETAVTEISEILQRPGSAASRDSLANRLQQVAQGLESSHPNLFGVVERTVNALGQMGI
jgi:hypothetical protein